MGGQSEDLRWEGSSEDQTSSGAVTDYSVSSDGAPRAIYWFRFAYGRVVSVDVLADETILACLDIMV
ncbi:MULTISPECIES: hypothetical protein [Brevibacterium]|uniref:Uncharacterized protein n=3 Tax=Brevibacterium TaxID=1696 RepID=A0A1D7VZQ0_BREAU|nr:MULTISPECIES: hypothetical protein [Brevibacterium]AOP52184.1 hypothetical protein BLSMQ_0468 [Brevibacterium aurantiacum]RCS98576.1 hypothetical protein CIK60_09425 [Brevibacterium aurantiacum]SMX74262.1 hypothetical protein BANT918_00968 [Brevibacterium antiquum CNRZ 918]SMX86911.1 hypothetical protein BANT10_02024 [Brevibacterium antiquum]HCG54862.1 hypothetical protein [Brevibacterium sp.]